MWEDRSELDHVMERAMDIATSWQRHIQSRDLRTWNLHLDSPDPCDEGSLEAIRRDLFGSHEEPHFSLEDPDLEGYEPSEAPEGDPEAAVRKATAGDHLWDDDELAEAQQREEDELEGNREIPVDHLYFVKPLKGKKSKEVMQAIQEIVLQLRMDNLPVVRIHSDRAHELRSQGLREWSLNNGILLTRTEGQSPQSNGTAERAVRFLKGKARLMLRASGLGPSHWATAMITAAHHQREDRLRPEEFIPPCPYGAKVAIKKKRYKDGGKHDLLPHWVKGTCLGPVWDVKNGSAVLDHEAGRITVTTHIRPRLHDPGSSADAPAVQFEPQARRRLTRKTPVDEDGLALRGLQGEEKAETRRELVEEIMKMIQEDPARPPKRPQLTEMENHLELRH